ncbi:hypothetical protein QL093DRAFT_2558766 [Fusarium oxysporum]|nr:hypothetical protein FOWG_18244 [Fusarium oxysporum f. sp. lycopersici MN25]KAJ9412309.1 hypothetical protein QL093DRAFT_2558766 [Fusarium oxysporum]
MHPSRMLLLLPLAVSVATTHIKQRDDQAATIEEAINEPHSLDERALVERDTRGILLACITGAGTAFQAYTGCYLSAFRNDPRTLAVRVDRTFGGRTSNVLVTLSGGALARAVTEVVRVLPGGVVHIFTQGASTVSFSNSGT